MNICFYIFLLFSFIEIKDLTVLLRFTNVGLKKLDFIAALVIREDLMDFLD